MKIILITAMIFIAGILFAETIWEDNFETNTGWILSGEFEIDSPLGLGGDHGNPDPASAFEGTKILGVDLSGIGGYSGDYEVSLGDREYYAISPPIDCSSFVEIEINFQKWLNVEQPAYDHAYIDISNNNGTSWIEIWTNSNVIENNSWSEDSYDISGIADLSSDVRIRFSIGSTDGSWQYSGWNIDDFKVTGNEVSYGAIEGFVRDSDTNEPISFAQIINQYSNALSDESGYFLLPNIPEGNRSIIVSALGYFLLTQDDITVTPDDTTYVLCEMEINPDTPASPQNLEVTIFEENSVLLIWEAPEIYREELLAYNVYRNGFILQSVLEETFSDFDLVGGTYSYHVSAVYDTGESLPSNIEEIIIPDMASDENQILQTDISLINYPNPFNPSTTISFSITQNYNIVNLEIFNLKGQKVKKIKITPESIQGKSGIIEIVWNGTDDNNKQVRSGVYLIKLVSDEKTLLSRKCLLLK